MCVWIFDAWNGENKYNSYIRCTTLLALKTSLELRNEHLKLPGLISPNWDHHL